MKKLFIIKNNEVVTDSRRISKFIKIEHNEVFKLIKGCFTDFSELGLADLIHGKNRSYYKLNASQAIFLISIIRGVETSIKWQFSYLITSTMKELYCAKFICKQNDTL